MVIPKCVLRIELKLRERKFFARLLKFTGKECSLYIFCSLSIFHTKFELVYILATCFFMVERPLNIFQRQENGNTFSNTFTMEFYFITLTEKNTHTPLSIFFSFYRPNRRSWCVVIKVSRYNLRRFIKKKKKNQTLQYSPHIHSILPFSNCNCVWVYYRVIEMLSMYHFLNVLNIKF